jgi:hypothetical protein
MTTKNINLRKSLFVSSVIFSFIASQFIWPTSAMGATLDVQATATPSSGPAPLNDVDVNISVSGTATGPVTYKIDCTSDGQWERNITLTSTTYSAPDLCDYPNAGSYSITVVVERGGLTYQTILNIVVFAPKTLSVQLTADPSSGEEPLNYVDLTATVSGTATGFITYRFDCTNDGTWDRTITTTDNPYTAVDLCSYPNAGNYTAKVEVTRESLSAQATTSIQVSEKSTMQLSIMASPSSGHAPLQDVDITATISGTVTGPITYKFDCTNDGVWDYQTTTTNTSYTAVNLCDYPNPGVYTIKVYAERNGFIIQGTGNIVVDETATLALDLRANPYFGKAPLYGVDITAFVSGSATGPITYKFDCTSDGHWDAIVTTNDTSYTANNLCVYLYPGIYTVKGMVERGGIAILGTTVVSVTSQ